MMDADWLEALARSLGAKASRRLASGIALSVVPLIGGVAGDATLAGHVASAKHRKRKKHKKHKKHQGPDEQCASCTTSICGSFPADCPLFPANNIWNARVDSLKLDLHSDDYVDSIGRDKGLHADFGAGLYQGRPIGIPFVSVPADQPRVQIELRAYADESDPGPYPVPDDAPIEGGQCGADDSHVLVVSEDCVLYELFHAKRLAEGGWSADSAARFDLKSNALRHAGWTSADAAGLPILPGLVRFEEVESGEIKHALRFTAEPTRSDYVWPARHAASDNSDPGVPPMGQRFRLKAGISTAGFSDANQVILTALKHYGMILADNGGDWFLSGAPDDGWDNDDLHELGAVTGDAFEAVDCKPLKVNDDSGEVADLEPVWKGGRLVVRPSP
jgi:hypothetical protein